MRYDGKLEVHLPYKTNGYRPCPCQKIILACKTKPYMRQFFENRLYMNMPILHVNAQKSKWTKQKRRITF